MSRQNILQRNEREDEEEYERNSVHVRNIGKVTFKSETMTMHVALTTQVCLVVWHEQCGQHKRTLVTTTTTTTTTRSGVVRGKSACKPCSIISFYGRSPRLWEFRLCHCWLKCWHREVMKSCTSDKQDFLFTFLSLSLFFVSVVHKHIYIYNPYTYAQPYTNAHTYTNSQYKLNTTLTSPQRRKKKTKSNEVVENKFSEK